MDPDHDRRRVRDRRESDSVEFDRVLYFSDAVFAIAMTLLAVRTAPAGRARNTISPTESSAACGPTNDGEWRARQSRRDKEASDSPITGDESAPACAR
jgi:hypothetical protein